MPWRGPRVPKEFPTLGYVVLQWIRDTLAVPDGQKMGQPFELYPEQQRHILRKYRLDPEAPGDAGNDAFQYSGLLLALTPPLPAPRDPRARKAPLVLLGLPASRARPAPGRTAAPRASTSVASRSVTAVS